MSDPKGAVVVGGSSGIGAAVVDLYRAQGRPVLVWDIAGKPDVECDVADPKSVDRAVAETLDLAGRSRRIDGDGGRRPRRDAARRAGRGMGPRLGGQHAGSLARHAGTGQGLPRRLAPASFIATSSVSARLVDRSMGTYCASKAALSMLVKVAACEWAPHQDPGERGGTGRDPDPDAGRGTDGRGWWGAWRTEHRWVASASRATSRGDPGAPQLGWVTGQVLEVDGGLALHSPIDAYGENTRQASR